MFFQKITTIEPLKTTYKDVNNEKINFARQTKATVKTNKKTIELLLLITKEQTTPLMGFDWMQRLKINLSSNSDAIKFHNIKLDNTEKRIIKLQNDFKYIFYNNNKMKNLCYIDSERWRTKNTTKGTINPNTSSGTSGARTETTIKTRISGKSNRNYRRLLCKHCNNNDKKRHRRRLLLTPQN